MFNVTATAPTLLLEARALSKAYGDRLVLDGVSLRVGQGEGMALLGVNGSGKTTLLSLCSGALRPDAGVVQWSGRDVRERNVRRKLGFVPQEPALYDELSGEENVAFFGRLAGLSGERLRHGVSMALEAADLADVRLRRAGRYSGGMKRRLSVACALVHGPLLLLLDEPFVGIDAGSRARLCELLAAQKQAGLALVLSTHRLDEVHALCERQLVLEAGRVVRDGEPDREPRLIEPRVKVVRGVRALGARPGDAP